MIVLEEKKTIMTIASQKSPETSYWYLIVVRSYLRHLGSVCNKNDSALIHLIQNRKIAKL